MDSKPLRFLGILACLVTGGCLHEPGDALRHDSYGRNRNSFTGDQDLAKRQTYIILSGSSQFRAAMDPENKNVKWSGGEKGFASGLAVAFQPDGYLLTAAHALNATNFVLGWFNGKRDVKPARVVFQRSAKTHADFALIKVEATLDHCGVPGDRPKAGDLVFAVVGYRSGTGVAVGFAGGNVLTVKPDPLAASLDWIRTDVPLWHGDSGGPLLSSDGRVVGINTGLSVNWRAHWADSFFPDPRYIQGLVNQDRAARASLLNKPDARIPESGPAGH